MLCLQKLGDWDIRPSKRRIPWTWQKSFLLMLDAACLPPLPSALVPTGKGLTVKVKRRPQGLLASSGLTCSWATGRPSRTALLWLLQKRGWDNRSHRDLEAQRLKERETGGGPCPPMPAGALTLVAGSNVEGLDVTFQSRSRAVLGVVIEGGKRWRCRHLGDKVPERGGEETY